MDLSNKVFITANRPDTIVEIEDLGFKSVEPGQPTRHRVVKGNALPKAMKEATNIVGKLTAAQIDKLKVAQEKRAARRK